MGRVNSYVKFQGVTSAAKIKGTSFSFIFLSEFGFTYLQMFIVRPISARSDPRAGNELRETEGVMDVLENQKVKVYFSILKSTTQFSCCSYRHILSGAINLGVFRKIQSTKKKQGGCKKCL